MVLWIYLPWCIVDGAKLLHDYIDKKPLERERAILAAVSLAALLLDGLAYAVFMHFHGDYITPTTITISRLTNWFDRDVLVSRGTEILSILGMVGNIGTDMRGRGYFVLKSCTALLNVISLMWLLSRRNSDRDKRDVSWYCLTVTGLVVVYLVFIHFSVFVDRYYTPAQVLLPLVSGAALDDWIDRGEGKIDRWPCLVIGLGIICLTGVAARINSVVYATPPADLVQMAEYIKDNGYKYVTGTYWNAGIMKGYLNGAVESQHSPRHLDPGFYLIDEHTFFEERPGVPNVLIITDDEETDILNTDEKEQYLLDTYAEKVAEFGVYNLYALTENPFTLNNVGLPPEKQQHKSDYPDAYGMVYQNAVIDENHELVSNGVEGHILWGPYTQSVPGTYDITLHYEITAATGAKEGYFDVALDTQPVAMTAFTGEDESVTLRNVEIEAGHEFEARVWTPEGMTMRVRSIEYERVE